jgi:ADP-ribose pyrophosphatase YjhB (NUDIX family)
MPFSNPDPVAIPIVPYKNKLVGIRRGIEPHIGGIAFPGGYINSGETFNEALTRELYEETGISVSTDSWHVFHIGDSLESNRILIFGICMEIKEIDLNFKSEETLEVVLIDELSKLTFPLHDEAKIKFFANLF